MSTGHFPKDICDNYEIYEWKHATAILKHDFPSEWNDIIEMLRAFKLLNAWIAKGGGNKSE